MSICGRFPFADFEEPLEIVKHLFVGSEGTFGFVSRATYHSVPDYKDKASAFIVFPTVEDASNATWELRKAGCTDAVELFDRRSLREWFRVTPVPSPTLLLTFVWRIMPPDLAAQKETQC